MKLKSLLIALTLLVSMSSFAAVTITEVGGWFESGYVTFEPVDGASTYAVYYKLVSSSEYLKLDSELVRNYGTYGRADVLGITAGTYQFKIVPVDANGDEMTSEAKESSAFEVKAHDRAGFAFSNGKVPGAYKLDGTLKNDAVVLYITDANKDKITLDVVTSSKGAITSCVGLQEILNGFKKGEDKRPLAFRLIGQVTDPIGDKGDIVVDMNGKTTCAGITIEGIGNDAVADGWGIRLKGASAVEIRNLAVMNCDSDEGDNIGLQQDNEYVWVHNCDFFYGHAGSDKDQVKGDGALDCKKSNYVTFSYNHFWDSGKCCLLSNGDDEYGYLITYHHNWFDHSDSRHPRVRCYSAHVYNNYFDGIAKYGVGATMGSSIFVENNYYRNTNKPMMISMQGTDAKGEGTFSSDKGGMIKAFGNEFAEKSSNFSYITYQQNQTSFDAYEASSRNEQVPASVKTLSGGNTYDNFDTNASKMYSYTPDNATDVPEVVKGRYGAGRMQHGDFQWAFNNSVDDASYDVNKALKDAVMNYTTSLVGIFGSTGGGDNPAPTPDPDPTPNPDPTPDPDSGYACTFSASNGYSNKFYSITGNTSNSKGTATVNGTTYEWGLKLESSTKISFTISEDMTLTLVFASSETSSIKINGEKNTASGNVYTCDLTAGTYELTKADTRNLFYINLTSKGGATIAAPVYELNRADGPVYDLSGRVVKNPQRGIYIQNGKKTIIQ